MEKNSNMSIIGKRKGTYTSKMKHATHLLLFRRHQQPGVKGWELRKALGSDYPKILEVLDDFLKQQSLHLASPNPQLRRTLHPVHAMYKMQLHLPRNELKPDDSALACFQYTINAEIEQWHLSSIVSAYYF